MRIPKNANSYVIPQLRDGYARSPTFDDLQPPVKRNRIEDLMALGRAVKRSRDDENATYTDDAVPHENDNGSLASRDKDDKPEKKRSRIEESLKRTVTNDDESSNAASAEHPGDGRLGKEDKDVTDAMIEDPDAFNSHDDFDSLVFKRVKDLCLEHGISIPKGAKAKPVFVSLLSAKFPNASAILGAEPLESFMKEALVTKCLALGLPHTGSKPILIQRLKKAGE